MKSLKRCVLFLVLLAGAAIARAEADLADQRAKTIAPLVEEETALVVHVDLTRVQLDPLVALFRPLLPVGPGEPDRAKAEIANLLNTAEQAGVRELYCLVTPGGQGLQPYLILALPIPQDADQTAVRQTLRIPANVGRTIEGLLVFDAAELAPAHGQPKPTLKAFRPAVRPELAAAFRAAGDMAVQVVLIPPAYSRRVIDEMMPQLPPAIGGGSSKVFSRGLTWAAVGMHFSPQASLRLVVQSPDAQAAEALRAKLAGVIHAGGQLKGVRQAVPDFDALATAMTPQLEANRLVLSLDQRRIEQLVSLVALPLRFARASASKMQSVNNLKQIALAMHNYAQANKQQFPPAVLYGPDGKTPYSWRIAILPYLDGGKKLYDQYHFDEPWDGPHNRTLIDKMPPVYRLPLSGTPAGRTNYLLPVGNGAGFNLHEPVSFKDIKDGTSNTIMVVEVDDQHAVVWTKPEDWAFDPKEPGRGLGHFFDGQFNAAFFDGSVQSFEKRLTDAETLRARFTRAGGEVVGR
ncbi:MAG: DUF1559 domain-containing protein [Planctomycetaceae bacterium]|nr:DUF1559 domain-containing protein [Planctomycetaceae bacterium]